MYFKIGDEIMYNKGDYVIYRQDVCKVKDIIKNHINGEDYYVLIPLKDDSLIIDVPVKNKMGWLRKVINRQDAESLIDKIADIEPIKVNDKYYELEYKKLFNEGTLEDLVKIIKTTYLRNDSRVQNKKKISETDNNYFKKAENCLYSELSISLGMSFDETKEYVINCVQKKVCEQ